MWGKKGGTEEKHAWHKSEIFKCLSFGPISFTSLKYYSLPLQTTLSLILLPSLLWPILTPWTLLWLSPNTAWSGPDGNNKVICWCLSLSCSPYIKSLSIRKNICQWWCSNRLELLCDSASNGAEKGSWPFLASGLSVFHLCFSLCPSSYNNFSKTGEEFFYLFISDLSFEGSWIPGGAFA